MVTVPPVKRHPFPAPPPGALVLLTADALLELVHLANPDADITVEWGEPVEVASWPIHDPIFVRHEKVTP